MCFFIDKLNVWGVLSSKQSQEVFVLMLSFFFFLHINVCLIWERVAEQTNFMQNFSKKNLTWLKLDDRTPESCEIKLSNYMLWCTERSFYWKLNLINYYFHIWKINYWKVALIKVFSNQMMLDLAYRKGAILHVEFYLHCSCFC